MINQKTGSLLVLFSLVCIIFAGMYGSTLPNDIKSALAPPAPVFDTASVERLALINRAFSAAPPQPYFEYTAGFENPFKKWSDQKIMQERSGSAHVRNPRSLLLLKGILTKNRPLAIIENSLGETQIRGIGEKAFDQTIIAIADNKVTLRDHLGKYEIIVNEQ